MEFELCQLNHILWLFKDFLKSNPKRVGFLLPWLKHMPICAYNAIFERSKQYQYNDIRIA